MPFDWTANINSIISVIYSCTLGYVMCWATKRQLQVKIRQTKLRVKTINEINVIMRKISDLDRVLSGNLDQHIQSRIESSMEKVTHYVTSNYRDLSAVDFDDVQKIGDQAVRELDMVVRAMHSRISQQGG